MAAAVPLFAAAVVIAHVAGAAQPTMDWIALTFIAARIAYAGFYLADVHLLRSLAWLAGFGACIALFIAAA